MKKKILRGLKRNNVILVLLYEVSLLVMIFVYMTGGTTRVYAHLMYVPIVIVASYYGKKKAIIHAIFSALLLGPIMPLNVSNHIAQEPINWIMRLVIFNAIAMIIGSFSDFDRKQREDNTNLLTHDLNTGLKNIEYLKREDESNGDDKTIIVLGIKDLEHTISLFGYNFRNKIINKIAEKLIEIFNNYSDVELYKYHGMQYMIKITKSSTCVGESEILHVLSKLNKSTLVVDSIPLYMEIQIGISDIAGDTSIFEGLRQALIAYYYANCNYESIIKFEPAMDDYYKNMVDIAGGFSIELSKNSIQAAYQKIVSAKDEQLHGVELLARWKKEGNQYLAPDLFIPIIEKTELIKELTKYMITRAVEFITADKDGNCIVSINFSIKDFCYDIIGYLLNAIDVAQINPERIQIEVIERTLVNVKELTKYIMILKEYNIKIALDDFGTGYCSYQYVNELPIDTIKIDKSIISNIDKYDTTKSLVISIVDFCKNNNIRTLAEGVETKEIADICKTIGIDYLQGYYYHKPQILNT